MSTLPSVKSCVKLGKRVCLVRKSNEILLDRQYNLTIKIRVGSVTDTPCIFSILVWRKENDDIRIHSTLVSMPHECFS